MACCFAKPTVPNAHISSWGPLERLPRDKIIGSGFLRVALEFMAEQYLPHRDRPRVLACIDLPAAVAGFIQDDDWQPVWRISNKGIFEAILQCSIHVRIAKTVARYRNRVGLVRMSCQRRIKRVERLNEDLIELETSG